MTDPSNNGADFQGILKRRRRLERMNRSQRKGIIKGDLYCGNI
jgi:hypothetical protein